MLYPQGNSCFVLVIPMVTSLVVLLVISQPHAPSSANFFWAVQPEGSI